jgi:hypothetical protein
MAHLKRLMLSRPCDERRPDETAICGDPGYRYDRLFVCLGTSSLMAYIYTGRSFTLRMGLISGQRAAVWWFDPRTGASLSAGEVDNKGTHEFVPPASGADWVLVLDDADQALAAPGLARLR